MHILAFDPGISGAYAWHYGAGTTPLVSDFPVMGAGAGRQINLAELCQDLHALISTNGKPTFVVIEDVHSMPRDGGASAFKFGQSKGSLLGVCAAYGLSIVLVSPAKWKADMRLTKDGEVSRMKALQRWPDLAPELKYKNDHNKAEAALLGSWFYECSPQAKALGVARKNMLAALF